MPYVNLSGTPNYRYSDPAFRLLQPNGTFGYSAYDAPFVYYDPRPDDPTKAGYTNVLTKLPLSDQFDLLLFASDYPALIQTVSTYVGESYTNDGNLYKINYPTFDESTLPLLGTSQVFQALNLQPPGSLGNLPAANYKTIFTGKTVTNGVSVSGFAVLQGYLNHGLYDAPNSQNYTAPVSFNTRVLSNTPVVYSTNTYVGLVPSGDTFAPDLRLPVILWEPQLTQEIADNGFVIRDVLSLCGPSELQVVGVWRLEDYSPFVVPPAAPLMAPMAFGADGDGAPAFDSTPATLLDKAKASLLEVSAVRAAAFASAAAALPKRK